MTARQVNGPDGAAKQAVEAVNNPNTQMKEKLMVDRTFKLYERLGEDERVELGEYPSRAAAQDRIERSVQTICHMDEVEEVQRMEFPLDDTLVVQFSGNTPNKVYEIEENHGPRSTLAEEVAAMDEAERTYKEAVNAALDEGERRTGLTATHVVVLDAVELVHIEEPGIWHHIATLPTGILPTDGDYTFRDELELAGYQIKGHLDLVEQGNGLVYYLAPIEAVGQ